MTDVPSGLTFLAILIPAQGPSVMSEELTEQARELHARYITAQYTTREQNAEVVVTIVTRAGHRFRCAYGLSGYVSSMLLNAAGMWVEELNRCAQQALLPEEVNQVLQYQHA